MCEMVLYNIFDSHFKLWLESEPVHADYTASVVYTCSWKNCWKFK